MTDIADALTRTLRSAPELSTSPGLAYGVAQDAAQTGADPTANAQAVAHGSNSFAQDQAVTNTGQVAGHPDLLHRSLGWLGGALHSANQATGGVAGKALHALGAPLHEIQRQYRYLHDVEARHGPVPALLEGLGIAAGATAGVLLTDSSQGGILGGELTSEALSHLFYRDSYDRVGNGAAYQGSFNRQTGQYQGPAGTVSIGRDISSALGLKPGTKPAMFFSGAADALTDLTLDPLVAAGKLGAAARGEEGLAGSRVAALAGRYPGTRFVTPDDVDKALQAYPSVRRGMQQLAGATTEELTSSRKWAPMAAQLGPARTVDDVAQVFKDHIDVARTVSSSLPTSTIVGGVARQVSQAIQNIGSEGEGGAQTGVIGRAVKSVTSFIPSTFDPATLSLSGKEFDPAADESIHGVYQVARMSMTKNAAEMLAGEYANATPGDRIGIYKNVVTRMMAARGLEEDSPAVKHELEQLMGGSAPGFDAHYGTGTLGRDISQLPATEDQPAVAAAIGLNQTGKLAYPNFNEITKLTRQAAAEDGGMIGNARRIYGNVDDFVYKDFTQRIFKRLALLSGGFAQRIAMAEAIPAAAREGVTNLVRNQLATTAAKLGYDATTDPEELGRVAGLVWNLGRGVDRLREGAGTLLTSPETVNDLSDMVSSLNGHRLPAAVDTTTHYSGEVGGASAKAERDLKAAHSLVPPGKQYGNRFMEFGNDDLSFDQAWAQKLGTISHEPLHQTAARAYLDALREQRPADIPVAEFYHGAARPLPETLTRAPSSPDNLFGPGMYLTDNPEVARDYTMKGGLVDRIKGNDQGTVHGIGWTSSTPPRFLDLEQAPPPEVRAIFERHFADLFAHPEQEAQSMRNASAAAWYQEVSTGPARLPRLNREIENLGYDGFRYQGGVRTGSDIQHNAYVVFAPDKLSIESRTSRLATRPATPAEATQAGAKAVTEHLRSMDPKELSLYQRATRSSTEGVDPLVDWGHVVMEDLRGATHSPEVADAAGIITEPGSLHRPLMDNVAAGQQTSMNTLAAIDKDLKPLRVEGRELIDIPHQSVLERISNFGFSRVLDPIINKLSREPIYANEWLQQYQPFKPLVESGALDKGDAIQLAHTRAVQNMVPFIHNTLERSQFAELAHNYMPFFFAQQQAFARYGRVLAENPGAFRQLQLETTGLHDTAAQTQDPNGNTWMVYPGLGFLTNATMGALGAAGIPVAGSVPISYSGRVASLSSVFPLSDVAPKFGPVVAIAGHVLENRFPEMRPAVSSVIGDTANSGGIWSQLVPNTALKGFITAFGDQHKRAFASAAMSTIQALALQQQQALDKWTAGGQIGPKPQIVPDDNAGPQVQQQFIDRVKNQTRIMFAVKAILGAFTPTAVTPNVGDMGLKADFQAAITKDGFAKGTQEFLAAHPDATPLTVFQSDSPLGSGAVLPSKAAEDFYNAHADYLKQFPYAGVWLVPQVSDPKLSSTVYNEQLAQGLRQKRSPEEFYRQLQIANGDQQFFGNSSTDYTGALKRLADTNAPASAFQALQQQAMADPAAGDYSRYRVALEAAKAGGGDATSLRANWSAYLQQQAKTNPVWYDDFTSNTRDNERQLGANQLVDMFTKGNVPPGPQTADLAGLVQDYVTYQNAVTAGRQDSFAVTSRAVLKQRWQDYVTRLAAEKPNLAPVISHLFRSL